MEKFFNKILSSIKENNACALATVVSSKGSAPRKVGAKMIVFADGSIEGTIGGGSLERLVISDARAALKKRRSFLKDYPLNAKSGLQVCGGKVSIFIDTLEPNKRLVIAGGGHIGLALSFVAKLLNFSVIIVDNRRAFANAKRFPHADSILCGSYKQCLNKISPDEDTYVVILTHRHLHDTECLATALKSRAGYIGMIGSKTKIKLVFNYLQKKGVKKERLDKVHTPIGLDIGAQTPEEIAVAIAAELIKVEKNEDRG